MFQTANRTPNATPMTAATTMSRVLQRVSGTKPAADAPYVVVMLVPNLRSRANAVSGRGRRQRVDGPASFAGTNRIRFRGSVARGHTLSALRSPEALFGCRPMVH